MPKGNFEADVLIFVSSDPRYDTRSSKFLQALTEAGYSAKVIGACSDGDPEEADGVVRVPLSAQSGKGFFLNFYQRVVPYAVRIRAKIVVAGDIFSLPPAILNKRTHSRKSQTAKLIYDSKELYDELPSLKRKRSSFFFWNLVEKSSVRYVDSVLTVNRSIADILHSKWRLPVTVVMNVPYRSDAPPPMKRFDKIVLAFSGGLQPGRGLHDLIKLMTLLPLKYELKIIGDGAIRADLSSFASSLGISGRVNFIGRVTNDRVVTELAGAHLGIYLMENSGLCHYLALPNKFFQFIAARLPVIVPHFPEMERLVERYGIGAAVDTSDLREVAGTVMKLTGDPDHYGMLSSNCETAASELNWENEKKNFLEVVGRLV